MCSSWRPASVDSYFTVNPTSASPGVARGRFTPTLQHVKRNWLQRRPAVVIWDQSNTVSAALKRGTTRRNMYCTHTHTHTHEWTLTHTCTYLSGSGVHVSGRPDRGTTVDSIHLLHKCKGPVPAFCQKETETHILN